ncbi:MAG: recombinase family protein, partial [Candidatus Marinimicrobia bacterium]|nr:recombinase family protein [Candidatus Neomarinimicrobiota bacterium]
MDESLSAFKKAYDDYTSNARLVAQEQVGLDYYRQLQASFDAPYIMVTGTLAAGTVIQGPIDKLKPAKALSNVRIQPDPHTGGPMGRLVLSIMGAFAEFEREQIRERTREGIARAVPRGSPSESADRTKSHAEKGGSFKHPPSTSALGWK